MSGVDRSPPGQDLTMEVLYVFPVVAATFVVVGATVMVAARRRTRAWKRFVGTSQVVSAQVLELRTKLPRRHGGSSTSRGPYFVPLVRFPLLDGRMVETETMTGSRPAPAKVGEVVMVRYDPADPTRANLADGLVNPGTGGCLLVGMGAGFVVLGLLVALVSVFLLMVASS